MSFAEDIEFLAKTARLVQGDEKGQVQGQDVVAANARATVALAVRVAALEGKLSPPQADDSGDLIINDDGTATYDQPNGEVFESASTGRRIVLEGGAWQCFRRLGDGDMGIFWEHVGVEETSVMAFSWLKTKA